MENDPTSMKHDERTTTIKYSGIRPDDPGGRNGLRNPERGWRLETIIAEPADPSAEPSIHGAAAHLEGRMFPVYNDHMWELDAARYEPFGLTMAQTYCYITEFSECRISDAKIALLEKSLARIRKRGLKTMLRFAYENGRESLVGPTLDRILGHLDQLAPVIQANSDVICVMQAGFVGAWGEWHSSKHQIEKDRANLARLMEKILDVLPKDRMTQVRSPRYKRWVIGHEEVEGMPIVDATTAHSGSPLARIGFHNDGFLAGDTCGGTFRDPPFFSNPGNPEFDYTTRESPYVAADGELFWRDHAGHIDGFKAMLRMRLHHYGTFSIWHSHSGREGKPYSIDNWMRQRVTAEQIATARLPQDDGYFTDSTGAPVERTAFEYITDHLGYRLELQQAKFTEALRAGGRFSLEVELINRGFAVPHNPRPVIAVLIDWEGRVAELPFDGVRPCEWQPFDPGDETFAPMTHPFSLVVDLPDGVEPGWYQLGLWLPDAATSIRLDPRYAVRMANRDVPWWIDYEGKYGVNIIGVVEVRGNTQ